MENKQDTKNILVIFKEGKTPEATRALTAENEDIKFQRLFSMKDELNRFKMNNPAAFHEASEEKTMESLYNSLSSEEKRMYRIYQVEAKSEEEANELANSLKNNENVEAVQFDYMNELYMEPNDPLYPQLYGLKKIQCNQAWDLSQGEQIVVAVIDTGIDYNHPDIKANMWKDANGRYGYDFSDNDDDPMDYHGHGTHVAGTIAASANNIEIIGVAPKAKVMAVKIFPNALDSVIVKALKYAVDNGARVLNNSWGPTSRRASAPVLEAAVDYVYAKGGIAIFAAGNSNDDVKYYSPANYSKTIAVGATDANDKRASFSNYGDLVDVAAPGVDILSLKYNSTGSVKMSGTSMACPHVVGLAALILSKKPSISYEQLRDILKNSADAITTDNPIGKGRINAFKALNNIPFNFGAVKNADGRIEVFVRGGDGALYHIWQTQPNGSWSNWAGLGGYITSEPAVVNNKDGRIEAFVRGGDGALYHIWQTQPNGGWSNWASLGGYITSNPAVVRNQDGRIEVFVRGGDGAVYHIWQTQPNGGWSSWASLGGYITSDISAVNNKDGRIEIFARGGDNSLYHIWQTQPNGGWSNWEGLGGYITSDPSAVNNKDGRIEVFVKGGDNSLYHIWQTQPNGGWSGWAGLGGYLTSDISAVQNQDGRIEVFVRGGDSSLYHIWQTQPNGGWSSWAGLGGFITSNPVATQNKDGRIETFVRGGDNSLYHIWQTQPNGGWSNWAGMGGYITAATADITEGTNEFETDDNEIPWYLTNAHHVNNIGEWRKQ